MDIPILGSTPGPEALEAMRDQFCAHVRARIEASGTAWSPKVRRTLFEVGVLLSQQIQAAYERGGAEAAWRASMGATQMLVDGFKDPQVAEPDE